MSNINGYSRVRYAYLSLNLGEVCRFHLAGQCDQGDECAYLHDVDSDDSGETLSIESFYL